MNDKLLSACEIGDLTAVKEMLDAGADPNVPDGDDCTALVLAAVQGHDSVVRVLLDAGGDPNIEQRGIAALVSAARYGHLECCQSLA